MFLRWTSEDRLVFQLPIYYCLADSCCACTKSIHVSIQSLTSFLKLPKTSSRTIVPTCVVVTSSTTASQAQSHSNNLQYTALFPNHSRYQPVITWLSSATPLAVFNLSPYLLSSYKSSTSLPGRYRTLPSPLNLDPHPHLQPFPTLIRLHLPCQL